MDFQYFDKDLFEIYNRVLELETHLLQNLVCRERSDHLNSMKRKYILSIEDFNNKQKRRIGQKEVITVLHSINSFRNPYGKYHNSYRDQLEIMTRYREEVRVARCRLYGNLKECHGLLQQLISDIEADRLERTSKSSPSDNLFFQDLENAVASIQSDPSIHESDDGSESEINADDFVDPENPSSWRIDYGRGDINGVLVIPDEISSFSEQETGRS